MQTFELSVRPSPPWASRVRVGRGVLDVLAADLLAAPPGKRLVVVSDSTVAPLHGAAVVRRLVAHGLVVEPVEFPAGEANKTRETKQRIEDRLLQLGVGRDGAIVAVGGGVTGDLAGFVAATWHRGIPVVQVPTTLLAMTDAALGGKTAVNLPTGKNLVGSFHQPWGVYADVSVLDSLPEADYRAGFAEMIKSAAIADASFFSWIESSVKALLARDAAALEHAVTRCLQIKAGVVEQDERETGRRAMLNFGHTVAHAIEAATGFVESHGRAVAAGMAIESRLAVLRLGFPEADRCRLVDLVRAFDLPVGPPAGTATDSLIAATYRDKKTREGRVHYAIPLRLGRMPDGDPTTVVDEADLESVLSGN